MNLFDKILRALFAIALAACAVFGWMLWNRGFFAAPDVEVPLSATAIKPYVSDVAVSIPAEIIIPKIKVDAKIESVGITSKGAMGTPSGFATAAWYKYGPRPGQPGPAVIDGHLDNALGLNGVFKHLGDLVPGDEIDIVTQGGTTTLRYKVTGSQELDYAKADLDKVWSDPYTGSSLHLITCSGDWIQADRTYGDRLLVTAVLVSTEPSPAS